MKTKGIRHVGLFTNEPEKMKLFYEQFFNFKTVWDKIEDVSHLTNETRKLRTIKLASDNGSQIELLTPINSEIYGEPKTYSDFGITHIALTVTNLEEILQKYLDNDYTPFKDNIFTNEKGFKILFLKDPDGNILELVEDPEVK